MGPTNLVGRSFQPAVVSARAALAYLRWRLSGSEGLPPAASAPMFLWSQVTHAQRETVPGMTSLYERSFCEWYTRGAWRGNGEIVELGLWLGSLTRALAAGLAARKTQRRIQAFDYFEWDTSMDEYAYDDETRAMRPGDSFRALYERSLGPLRPLVSVHEADLSSTCWDSGPIALLVVDAMKSWELVHGIVEGFFPSLQPGSLVMHQDFAHPHTPWIPLVTYRQRKHLRVFADLPACDTMVFEVIEPFASATPDLAHPLGYGPNEVNEAFEYWMRIARPDKQEKLGMAKASFYLDIGDFARATRAVTDQFQSSARPSDLEVQRFHVFMAERQTQHVVYDGYHRITTG